MICQARFIPNLPSSFPPSRYELFCLTIPLPAGFDAPEGAAGIDLPEVLDDCLVGLGVELRPSVRHTICMRQGGINRLKK